MAVQMKVFFDMFDAQHRSFTFEFFATPPASWGAGVNLPTLAHIQAVYNAICDPAMTAFSTARLRKYGVQVFDTDLTGFNVGQGSIAVPNYLQFRSGVDSFGEPDPFGDLQGIENKIPCTNQDVLVFTSNNRNAVSTIGSLWTALRTALVNIGFTDVAGNTYTAGLIAQDATFFDGKRAPFRPR
jgi:hypothetical protein